MAKPTALACGTRTNVLLPGSYASRQSAAAGTPGGAFYENRFGWVSTEQITFSSGDPAVAGDETIRLGAGMTSATLTSFGPTLVGASDALGGFGQRDLGGGQRLRVYNLNYSADASSALDYVLIYRFDGLYEPVDSATGVKASYPSVVFGAAGQLAAPLSAGVYFGAANYRGQTRGLYSAAGQDLETRSALNITLNLATGTLTGRASSFEVLNTNGVVSAAPSPLDFDFRAEMPGWKGSTPSAIFSGGANGTQAGRGFDGRVDGAFYGAAGGSPEEIGLSYSLALPTNGPGQTSAARYFGTGAASLIGALSTAPIIKTTDCSSNPAPVSCRNVSMTLTGPSASVVVSSTGAVTRRIDGPDSQTRLSIDAPNFTLPKGGYFLTYGPSSYQAVFTDFTTTSDGLGSYSQSRKFGTTTDEKLYLINIDNVFAANLDYLLLASFERGTSSGGAELGFMPVGVMTPASAMPKTGTARFEGGTRGTLWTGTTFYTTASDIEMSANFATGALSGSSYNFRTRNQSGALVTLGNNPNFSFTGSIASGTSTFSGPATARFFNNGGPAMTGTVQGGFFGPAATEVGLVYDLSIPSESAYMQGGAVLGPKL